MTTTSTMPPQIRPRATRTSRAAHFALIAAGLALTTPFTAAHAQSPPDAPRMNERTVTVSAAGSTSAIPDLAYISSGVMTEASTAREAMSLNNAVMAKVIDGLKALGITATDIQTTSINVNPRYTNPRDGKAPVVNGYQAHNTVRITVRNLTKLGDILDNAVTLGANQMGGISFDVSTAEQLKDEARKAAMTNARRRAELYANAAGANLGQVLTISEDVRMAGPRPVSMARMAASADSVPVETGSMKLETTIHVTWSLK
ncbi:MAG: SIMPL domain-containing protein [Hyphomicrobiaceae bacterium]|nr:SIMPL domain-containing protein [Hyphomicrobiaceae bacterium]